MFRRLGKGLNTIYCMFEDDENFQEFYDIDQVRSHRNRGKTSFLKSPFNFYLIESTSRHNLIVDDVSRSYFQSFNLRQNILTPHSSLAAKSEDVISLRHGF